MRYALLAALLAASSAAQASSITDLTQWTQVEDPADPGMSAMVDSPSQATLSASGAIPSGTDIGYASVNGADVASSTSGFAFDPASDFEIAIDYNLSLVNLMGAGGIGFGIGEDAAGANSAGIGLGFAGTGIGTFSLFGTASRTNDVDGPAEILTTPGSLQGRFFVGYEAASGNVTVGINPTPGAASPSEPEVLLAVQEGWTDAPLLASFFIRSQSVTLTNPMPVSVPAMSAGDATAVFSNFEVLSGTPIGIPEPGAALLASVVFAMSWPSRRGR